MKPLSLRNGLFGLRSGYDARMPHSGFQKRILADGLFNQSGVIPGWRLYFSLRGRRGIVLLLNILFCDKSKGD